MRQNIMSRNSVGFLIGLQVVIIGRGRGWIALRKDNQTEWYIQKRYRKSKKVILYAYILKERMYQNVGKVTL